MNEFKVSRAAAIARRINGPVVIMDEALEPVVVVPLEQYEAMVDGLSGNSLTSSGQSATINRDIAMGNPGVRNMSRTPSADALVETGEDQYYMEPLE